MIDRDMVPEVDLSTCDNEPIHIIGRIQSFGFLIAFSSDWIVQHVSANCEALLGRSPGDAMGTPADELLSASALHSLRSRLQVVGNGGVVDRSFGVDLLGDGRLFDVAMHSVDRSFVLEAEPAAVGRRDYVGYVRPMVDRLRRSGTVDELCQMAARQMRGLTGFDRVMLYRFDADGAGEVIAESRGGGIDSFQGLHFPASDIPAQARRLYCRNLLRIIADVDDPTVPIVPAINPHGQPLDLSMSGLRAVSPIHIEYLRNMGVKASMSVSIVRNGELWGLITCHHYAPLNLDYAVRTASELFGEFFAFILEQTELRQASERADLATRMHDEIMGRVAAGASVFEAFDGFADTIGKVIPSDGIAGWIDGQLVARGQVPQPSELAELARFLNTTGSSRIWHSSNLGAAHPPAQAYADCCAGVLALPVSRSPRDYILLCRREQPSAVNWAGNPEKAVELGPNGARLTPRKSFELWKEERTGHSASWTGQEVSIAESLRITLLEVVLRMSETAQRERENANRKQGILIAELNHRVRNLLNLVKGLVAQSRSGAETIAQFAEVVGERIHALARAHDLVTQKNWSPAPLAALIAEEGKAYAGDNLERVRIEGTNVLVEPAAFSTLALVVHELMTNSCKYGALSARAGHVTVAIARDAAGGVDIVWREQGGPAVSPPTRRGFGSSIIEHSVPHELGGTTRIDYAPDGLIARIGIPAEHLAGFVPLGALLSDPAVAAEPGPPTSPLCGDVLIVEDKMIIAMEAEVVLTELGAERCHIVANVAQALNVVEAETLTFAMLDINLGEETSEAVAAVLQQRGIPFVVASGYGDAERSAPALAAASAITKPYSAAQLREAVANALQRAAGAGPQP